MAIVNIVGIINHSFESGVTALELQPVANSANPITIGRGDTLRFQVYLGDQAAGYTFVVSGFDGGGLWNSTANSPTIFPNGVFSAVSSPSAPVNASGTIDILTLTASGGNAASRSVPVYVRITDGTDTTPDPFELGPTLTNVSPTSLVASNQITVSGINQPVSAVLTGGGYFTVNNSGSFTNTTVANGDSVRVFLVAPNSFSATVTLTLNINGVSDTFTIITAGDPGAGIVINFPKTTNPVSLQEVINFFGGSIGSPPRNMKSYYKGGTYVPNIPKNANIPTSGVISLQKFLGSGTAMYFTKLPYNQFKSVSTIGSSRTLVATWTSGGLNSYDFDVGYGPGMRNAVSYRYTLEQFTGSGVTLTSSSGSPGTYSQDNKIVSVNKTSGPNTEMYCSGEITIYIRSLYPPNPVVTAKVQYFLDFYGP